MSHYRFFSRFFAVCMFLTIASAATAADLATPSGLIAGDKFRFVFVTAGTITGSSTDIAVYNAFVNTEAGSATYNSGAITWAAIGSTSAIDARVNVGGFASNVPVYLVTGTKVADNLGTGTNGLWSGTILAPVNQDVTGTQITASPTRTWTGTRADGTGFDGFELGNGSPDFGSLNATDGTWLFTDGTGPANLYHMYAVSQELTVVPEPSSVILCSLASGALTWTARRRLGRKNA